MVGFTGPRQAVLGEVIAGQTPCCMFCASGCSVVGEIALIPKGDAGLPFIPPILPHGSYDPATRRSNLISLIDSRPAVPAFGYPWILVQAHEFMVMYFVLVSKKQLGSQTGITP